MRTFFNGRFTDEQIRKSIEKYLRLLFDVFKMTILADGYLEWIDLDDINEFDLTYDYFQFKYMLRYPKLPNFEVQEKARDKVKSLEHPTIDLIKYIDWSTREDFEEHQQLELVYIHLNEELIHYVSVISHLLCNISNEEACKLLGYDYTRALLLNEDLRSVVSDCVKTELIKTKRTDIVVPDLELGGSNHLEFAGHKKFWRFIKDSEKYLDIKDFEIY